MRRGGPPRGPRSGPSPAGPWRSPSRVQICESPQSPTGRTTPAGPGPAAPSGVRGSPRPGRPASAKRARPRTLPHFGSRLWSRRRPPSPKARGPAPPRPASPRPAPPRFASPRPASPAASPRTAPRAARGAGLGGGAARGAGGSAGGEVLPGQRAGKMAAPMELFCWSGGWGLPSVDLDSLAVLVRGGAVALCCALEDWGGSRTSRSSGFDQGASARAHWGKLRQSKTEPGRRRLSALWLNSLGFAQP